MFYLYSALVMSHDVLFFSGNVHTLGRAEYGRLGLGENCGERREPAMVKLEGKCTDISAGSSVSFALMEDG